jgi:phosphocarrier protein HPr
MSDQTVERIVVIVNPAGVHARPAAMLVQLASKFSSETTVGKDGLDVNAKSIMGVLLLAAECGAQLRIRSEGDDAQEAVDAIAALVARGFEES